VACRIRWVSGVSRMNKQRCWFLYQLVQPEGLMLQVCEFEIVDVVVTRWSVVYLIYPANIEFDGRSRMDVSTTFSDSTSINRS
jgi:hypothetical protein